METTLILPSVAPFLPSERSTVSIAAIRMSCKRWAYGLAKKCAPRAQSPFATIRAKRSRVARPTVTTLDTASLDRLGLDFTCAGFHAGALEASRAELQNFSSWTDRRRTADDGRRPRFGCAPNGYDSLTLQPLAHELGSFRCHVPVLSADGGAISSTNPRSIGEYRLRDAEAMPAARIAYGPWKGVARAAPRLSYRELISAAFRPLFGVYATIAVVDGASYGSVSNGRRPTVTQPEPGAKPDLLVETHLFDFDGDLYDKKMEVLFIEKLRDERRFPDVQALVEQIKKDETKAREILRAQSVLKQ